MAKRQYSDEDKAIALVALKANGGNLSKTARETGFPLSTIRNWRDGNGVVDEVAEIGNEKAIDFANLLRAELMAIFDTLPDKRDDAKYRELATAAGIFIDKLQLLTGDVTERNEVEIRIIRDDD